MTTDNLHLFAVLALDVRPSSVNVNKIHDARFDIEVLLHETIGRPFDSYAMRFEEACERAFQGSGFQEVQVRLTVVSELSKVFERQEVMPIVMKVGD